MIIKVYVSCCGADKALAVVNEAVKQSGVDAEVELVKDYAELAKAGVISTPAIKVNDKLVVAGRVPKVADMIGWLTTAVAK